VEYKDVYGTLIPRKVQPNSTGRLRSRYVEANSMLVNISNVDVDVNVNVNVNVNVDSFYPVLFRSSSILKARETNPIDIRRNI
jgi:hypothetical protein